MKKFQLQTSLIVLRANSVFQTKNVNMTGELCDKVFASKND